MPQVQFNLSPTVTGADLEPRAHQSRKYIIYMRSPRWQHKRKMALRRAKYRCQNCGIKTNLQVHHLTYERLGHERPEDLVVLCETHHREADKERARKTQDRIQSRLIGW